MMNFFYNEIVNLYHANRKVDMIILDGSLNGLQIVDLID